VLSSFTKEEKEALSAIYTKALSGVEKIVSEDIDGAMQICNGK